MEKVLCKSCYKLKPDDGYYNCEECRMRSNDRNKSRRAKLIEDGRCGKCGEITDRAGKSLCQKCLNELNDYRRNTSKFRNALGFCARCGKNRVFGDEKNCPECRAYFALKQAKSREGRYDEVKRRENERRKERRRRFVEQGLCSKCGRQPPDKDYKICSDCRKKIRSYNEKRKKREEYRAEAPDWATWDGN